MKLNIKLLLISIAAGVAALVVDILLYNALVDVWARPLLIAVLLAVLAVVVCAAVFVTGTVTGQSDETFFFLDSRAGLLIGLVVALVVLFLAGMGLEWVYDHDKDVVNAPTSYIFLLDESGSMLSNDPNYERYTAVNTVMGTVAGDFPYAVYMFANDCSCVREMAPASQGQFQPPTDTSLLGGGTEVRTAMQKVLDDFQAGKFAAAGSQPRVILLTDGVASDMSVLFGSREILSNYRAAGLSVSTVGLGNVDRALMNHIAKKTGGVYVNIDSAQELAQGFSAVASADTSRDLLCQRDLVELDFLYGVMRVVFLTILGAIIAVMKAMAYAREDSNLLIILVGAIGALVGGLLVEVLMLMGAPVWSGMTLYGLLVAATPAWMPVRRYQSNGDMNYF